MDLYIFYYFRRTVDVKFDYDVIVGNKIVLLPLRCNFPVSFVELSVHGRDDEFYYIIIITTLLLYRFV